MALGDTVAGLKSRMTYAEFLSWVEYRRKRGPLHMIPHADSGFALLATLINNALGGKAEMTDFMPYADKQPASIEDVFKVIANG